MKSLRGKIILTAECLIPTNKDVHYTVEDEIYRKIGQISTSIQWIIRMELGELKDETYKK